MVTMIVKFQLGTGTPSIVSLRIASYLEVFLGRPAMMEAMRLGYVRLSPLPLAGLVALLNHYNFPFVLAEMTPAGNSFIGNHEGFGDGGKGIVVMQMALIHDHTGDGIKFQTYEEHDGAGAVDPKRV